MRFTPANAYDRDCLLAPLVPPMPPCLITAEGLHKVVDGVPADLLTDEAQELRRPILAFKRHSVNPPELDMPLAIERARRVDFEPTQPAEGILIADLDCHTFERCEFRSSQWRAPSQPRRARVAPKRRNRWSRIARALCAWILGPHSA